MDFTVYIFTFAVVFLLNLIPIIGPPTWLTLSVIAFWYQIPNLPLFIIVAICASTSGRFFLTQLSKKIIRNKLLRKKYLININYLRDYLLKNKHIVSIIFLVDAFTPLPSDQLFIAYGMTGMKERYALIPFAIGRTFTYSFWVFTASELSNQIAAKSLSSLDFLTLPFILGEICLMFLVYLYIKLDWKYLLKHKKFKFIKK